MSNAKCVLLFLSLCMAVIVVFVSVSSMYSRGKIHYKECERTYVASYNGDVVRSSAYRESAPFSSRVPPTVADAAGSVSIANGSVSQMASSPPTVRPTLSRNNSPLPLLNATTQKYVDKDDFKTCRKTMKDCRKRLPQAIIIGAKKCGTGTLRYFLRVHPQVAFSSYVEIHYFNSARNYGKGIKWYRKRMKLSRTDQVTIEKTPRYFVSSVTPSRIHDNLSPSTKIILLLRDPVERSISDYLAVRHMSGLTGNRTINSSAQLPPYVDPVYDIRPSFEDSVLEDDGSIKVWNGLINIGLYSNHLRRWLDVFPREQILVLDSDVLKHDPLQTLKLVEGFLDLKPFFRKEHFKLSKKKGFYCLNLSGKVSCQGSSKGRKHPTVDQSVTDKLRAFYQPYNDALRKLLNQNFSWANAF